MNLNDFLLKQAGTKIFRKPDQQHPQQSGHHITRSENVFEGDGKALEKSKQKPLDLRLMGDISYLEPALQRLQRLLDFDLQQGRGMPVAKKRGYYLNILV